MSRPSVWYRSFWQSRKWVAGTFFFAAPIFALRWFEHLGDTAFAGCICTLIGALFAASEYSKRTDILRTGGGITAIIDEIKAKLGLGGGSTTAAKPGEEP